MILNLALLGAVNVLQLVLQAAAAGNRTIDDSSITEFTFGGNWLVNSCSKCDPQPNSGQAHNGTWHTNNVDVATMQLEFTGSAIWLFGILAPAATQGSLTIVLDRDPQTLVVYNRSGTSDSSYSYNELLFTASSLSGLPHLLTLTTGEGNASGHSILIDSAVVNSDFPPFTPEIGPGSHNPYLGTIIGPVVGGLILLSIIGTIIRRRRVVVTPAPVTYYEQTTVMVPVTAMRPVTVYR